MNGRIYDRERKNQQKTSSSTTTLDWGMPQVRSFTMQLKTLSHLPDLKTSFSRTEHYGHHLDKIQLASISSGTPIQMLSAIEEDENQRMSSKLIASKSVLDTVLNVKKQFQKSNNKHKKNIDTSINSKTNPNKHLAEAGISTETSISKNKGKDKNSDDLTSPATHQVPGNKATENTSLPQDPEVTRLLNKGTKNSLAGLKGDTQRQNQDNFIAPASIYNKDKNTPPPKAGTRSQLLAKKEAMNLLGNNKGFSSTQLALKKVSVGDTAKTESVKAQDKQHQVELKNAAELVRGRVINDDRQVKEHLRGNFNLDPDIVAKDGGEQLILQKV